MTRKDLPQPGARLELDPISLDQRIRDAAKGVYERARDLALQADSMRLAAGALHPSQDSEQILKNALAFQTTAVHLAYQAVELGVNAGAIQSLAEIRQVGEHEAGK